MSERKIKNPIIPGFYPDPSICRVGEDFYMVCSSFEMYPGIPVFHSKDLANWEQIGYAMRKENGFHVEANAGTGGVMAPTIRYHKGTYYIINANFSDKGNFIVTAKNPAGPWSNPYYLTDVPGIDASIFFDEDDTCYVIGTGNVVARADGTFDRGIWLAEFDIENMKMAGEPVAIWDSALRNASSPEAPHIYKIGDYYYLIIAEGGTEHYHSVAVARSKDLKGWYEGYCANPVMTHRHLGFYYEIGNIGHADLVDTPDGNWYAVMLGSRTIEGVHKNLGRETYICPVVWEREWPVFSPGSGKIEWEYPADEHLPWTEMTPEPEVDEFEEEELGHHFTFWGTPYEEFWKVEEGRLKIKCLKRSLTEQIKPMNMEAPNEYDQFPAFIGRRQRHLNFQAACRMTFVAKEKESAGLLVLQATNHQFKVQRVQKDGQQVVQLVQVTTDFNVPPYLPGFTSTTTETVLAETLWVASNIVIGIEAVGEDFTFYYGSSKDTWEVFGKADGKIINPEKVGGMIGTVIGMFASANGGESDNEAAFDWFSYKEI